MLVTAAVGCNAVPANKSESQERNAAMSAKNIYDFSLNAIDGTPTPLSAYRGKVLLVVNVASECGYTPQYAGLQELYQKYSGRGLVVLGVPANEFGRQEPGSNEEIAEFCSSKFHVTFPMFEKIVVKGEGQHPLYAWLTSNGDPVSWNFNKFLIDKNGAVVKHYSSKVEPLSGELTGAIEAQL
jgi:glutathione peroxidase